MVDKIIWDKLKNTFLGRVTASMLIGLAIGLPFLAMDIKYKTVCLHYAGAVIMCMFACLILEWRDYRIRKRMKKNGLDYTPDYSEDTKIPFPKWTWPVLVLFGSGLLLGLVGYIYGIIIALVKDIKEICGF